ncbi:MAG: NAD-dependent epimerase/dehydratase family protein, partial [Blastocatellia bacterium]
IKVLEEAEKRGVKTTIYVSSAGVIGRNAAGKPGDETSAPPPIAMTNLYFKSKVLAEEAVKEFIRSHSMPVVQILPGFMFGPGDVAPTGSGQMVLDYINKKIPGVIDGAVDIVDERDVAAAMINAVEKGKNGERYIVAGQYFELQEIFDTLEKATGVSYPKRRIPYGVIVVYAWAMEMYSRITGKPILISRDGVRIMHAKTRVDSSRAIKELGAHFRPLAATIQDEVDWYLKHGYAG